MVVFVLSVFNSHDNSIIYEKAENREENRWLLFSEIHLNNNGDLYTLEETFYDEASPQTKSADKSI